MLFSNFFPWDFEILSRVFFPLAGEIKWEVHKVFRSGSPFCSLTPKLITIYFFSINTFISFISYKLSHKLRKAFGDSTRHTKTKLNLQQYQKTVSVEKWYSVSLYTSILVRLQSSLYPRVRAVIYCFLLDLIIILWWVVFIETLAHAPVVVPVTEFWASVETSEFVQAFSVFGVAGAAAVEQVQAQVLALVFWFPLEHDCWS